MLFSQSFELLVYAMLAIFAIANPITSVPIFLSHTPDDPAVRRKVAADVGRNVVITLSVTLILGSVVLDVLQISIPALRCAGGLVIVLIGIQMLFNEPTLEPDHLTGKMKSNPAFVPLTVPSLAGPGSISIVMEGATRIHKLMDWREVVAAYGVCFAVIFIFGIAICFVLRWADPIARKMGPQGLRSFQKLSGFLFICIGMQILSGGIFGFIARYDQPAPGGQIRIESTP